MVQMEIADGDPRSNWLPRNPDDRMMSARDLAALTGLGETSMRKFVKKYGFKVGAKYRYISYRRFKEVMKQIEEEGGRIDG